MFSNVQWILGILSVSQMLRCQLRGGYVLWYYTCHNKVMSSSYMCFVLGNNSVVITSFTVVKL